MAQKENTLEASKSVCLSLEYVSTVPVEEMTFILLRGKGVNHTASFVVQNRLLASEHFLDSRLRA